MSSLNNILPRRFSTSAGARCFEGDTLRRIPLFGSAIRAMCGTADDKCRTAREVTVQVLLRR